MIKEKYLKQRGRILKRQGYYRGTFSAGKYVSESAIICG
jgi:hypothetical protein